MRLVEPCQGLGQFGDSSLGLPRLDQAVAPHRLDVGPVERDRRQGKRLRAAPESGVDVTPLDMRRARSPPPGDLEPQIVHSLTVLQGPAAILQAPAPLPHDTGGRAQGPQGTAGPPDVPSRFEVLKACSPAATASSSSPA